MEQQCGSFWTYLVCAFYIICIVSRKRLEICILMRCDVQLFFYICGIANDRILTAVS